MLNQERNLKRTSLAKGEKGTYKQTKNKQTAAAAVTAASKNRKKRTTLHHS